MWRGLEGSDLMDCVGIFGVDFGVDVLVFSRGFIVLSCDFSLTSLDVLFFALEIRKRSNYDTMGLSFSLEITDVSIKKI